MSHDEVLNDLYKSEEQVRDLNVHIGVLEDEISQLLFERDEMHEIHSATVERAKLAEEQRDSARAELAEVLLERDDLQIELNNTKALLAQASSEVAGWIDAAQRCSEETIIVKERAAAHWESAKHFCRELLATEERAEKYYRELKELKAALRTLGGDRP